MIRIVAYGNAQPAGSKTAGVTKTGRRFVRDDNPASREWKQLVSRAAGDVMHGRPLYDGPLELDIVFYRPRPASHYGKRGLRAAAPDYPTVRPDTTKLLRAAEDALTGIVWRDDAQIISQYVAKFYGEPARVEIHVRPLAPPDQPEEVTNAAGSERPDRAGDRRDGRGTEDGDEGGGAVEPAEVPGARARGHAPGDRAAVAHEGPLTAGLF